MNYNLGTVLEEEAPALNKFSGLTHDIIALQRQIEQLNLGKTRNDPVSTNMRGHGMKSAATSRDIPAKV